MEGLKSESKLGYIYTHPMWNPKHTITTEIQEPERTHLRREIKDDSQLLQQSLVK